VPSAPESLLLLFGSLMVASGLLGGGLELTQLKIPKIASRSARAVLLIVGMLLLLKACATIGNQSISLGPIRTGEYARSATYLLTSCRRQLEITRERVFNRQIAALPAAVDQELDEVGRCYDAWKTIDKQDVLADTIMLASRFAENGARRIAIMKEGYRIVYHSTLLRSTGQFVPPQLQRDLDNLNKSLSMIDADDQNLLQEQARR
jgi:hypothetical protein